MMLEKEKVLANMLSIAMHDWPRESRANMIGWVTDALKEQRETAIAAEREACAALADEFKNLPHGHVPASGLEATWNAADQIASAIRARGTTT